MTIEDVMNLLKEHHPHARKMEERSLRHVAEVVHKQGMKTGLTPYQVIDLYRVIENAFLLDAWS